MSFTSFLWWIAKTAIAGLVALGSGYAAIMAMVTGEMFMALVFGVVAIISGLFAVYNRDVVGEPSGRY